MSKENFSNHDKYNTRIGNIFDLKQSKPVDQIRFLSSVIESEIIAPSEYIESPEIADAMGQFFLFAKKYIRKATD